MTDWTPEEERALYDRDIIASAIREAYGERCPDVDTNCMCCRAWAAYDRLPRWRDVKTDPPPRDGTSILTWIDGFGMGPQVLFWLDGGWREPANHMRLKKEPSFWQPIAPPLPPAPEPKP